MNMVQLFLQNSQLNFYPKIGCFSFFFQLIKNYAETALVVDENYILQEASYTAQQSSRKVESQKTWIRENIFA